MCSFLMHASTNPSAIWFKSSTRTGFIYPLQKSCFKKVLYFLRARLYNHFMKKIRKAVFPVAGLGSRFLPATKASPKEMLPIVDKPLIQYAVEEAVAAGITDMVFITGRNKRAIEDHFDKAYELETELLARDKHGLLDELRHIIPNNINCIYIRQVEARGLGHAVLCAEPVVGNEPFAVVLADDLIDAPVPALKQMVDVYGRKQTSLVAAEEVDPQATASWGICDVAGNHAQVASLLRIVEKPQPKDAPSNLGVVGRYVFTPRIFEHLRHLGKGAGGEIQLTDGIASLLLEEDVSAYRFDGKRYDCGAKLGYLQATVALGLKHKEGGDAFAEYLKEVLSHRL
jgi:UTP--glucose-1-phosphate uridylyltransferase